MQIRGLSLSIILHSLMLLIIGIGIPMFLPEKREIMPVAISVEVLPIAKQSNVPKSQKPVSKEESKPKPAPKKKPPKPKPTPAVKPVETPARVAAPKPKEEAKKPDKKPKPKPAPKKKPKQEDSFDQLLKDLTEEASSSDTKKRPKKPTPQSSKSRSDRYDPSLPLSLSEKDAIRAQFMHHWRMPAGMKNDYTLAVEVRILVARNGTVTRAAIASHQAGRYRSDPFFRAAADSALRAVQLASPLKNLSAEKYSSWKDMVVNFDPKEMLY